MKKRILEILKWLWIILKWPVIILGIIILIPAFLMPFAYILIFLFSDSCSIKHFLSDYSSVSDALSTTVVAIITVILAYLYWRKDKLLKLIEEYNDLSETRVLLWGIAGKKYKEFLDLLNNDEYSYMKDRIIQSFDKVDNEIVRDLKLDEKLDMLREKSLQEINAGIRLNKLIKQTGFPMPNDLLKITKFDPESSIYDWIKDNIKNLCFSQATLLLFAFYCLSDSKMDEVRRKLAFFWYKWAYMCSESFIKPFDFSLLNKRYYDSNHPELFFLTWLEIALAYRMGRPGKGKVEFLKLSQYFWENKGK